MIRKIIKIGNSDGVTIPVSVMRAYKLKAGDKVDVRLQTSARNLDDNEVVQAALEIVECYKSDFQKLASK